MSMEGVAIPYACGTDGRLWSCIDAPKSGRYSCPACRERVILKRGDKKRPHFAHAPGSLCVGESVLHLLSKMMVRQVLWDWKVGVGPEPTFALECDACGKPVIKSTIPEFDTVQLETPYHARNGVWNGAGEADVIGARVLDVALLRDNAVVGGIELRATHAVDELKAEELGSLPWIELLAKDVLDSPTLWKPLQESWMHDVDRPHAQACEQCVERVRAFYDLRKRLSIMRGQPILDYKFRTAPYRCWRCDKAILVYAFLGDDFGIAMHEAEMDESKAPGSIQHRWVAMQNRRTWVNACPCCDAVQGEWFLHNEPTGSFFGFRVEDDEDHRDYLRIAYVMEEYGGRRFPRPQADAAGQLLES